MSVSYFEFPNRITWEVYDYLLDELYEIALDYVDFEEDYYSDYHFEVCRAIELELNKHLADAKGLLGLIVNCFYSEIDIDAIAEKVLEKSREYTLNRETVNF